LFENDVGSWDASICKEICEFEVWLANKMGATRAVIDLMKANIDTHGYTNHGIKYSICGTRKSGDPYTSCFNSVINGLLHCYAICISTGLHVTQLKDNVFMLVQGDDNCMVLNNRISPDWNIIVNCGFECENLYRQYLRQVEFCSSRIYKITGGYSFGPKLGKMLNKLCCFNCVPYNIHPKCIVAGIRIGLFSYSFVPLVKEIQEMLYRYCGESEAYYLGQKEDWKMHYPNFSGEAEVNYDFLETYGMDHYIYSIVSKNICDTQPGQDLDLPLIKLLFDLDTQGKRDIFM